VNSSNDETNTGAPESGTNPTSVEAPDLNATIARPYDHQARLAANASAVSGVAVPGFVIESTLGRGGMGVVYKATQTGLNRVVALKMLIAGQYADPGLRARFLLEAESIAALEHPHIIRVFAFGDNDGHPYLAMEFVSGGTLAERIKKNGPLPAKEATELVAKLAAAVAHAHSRGVVHRDIKPLNVLLTAEGEPRLTDFGLAKVGRADQNLSVTGQVLGTPAYMAPEQAAGKVHEVGTAADVYAIGAVLYDVLTGRPPFQGDSAAVTLQKVLTEEPSRPRKLNASIPHDLETICLKCLEKDPAKRYPTAQALADDLHRYLGGEPISARPLGTASRAVRWVRRNPAVAGLLATIAVVTFGLVGSLYGQYRQAVAQATTEREKKEAAEHAQQQAEMAQQNAERAEKAERISARNAAEAAAQAAQANTLTDALSHLFRSSDPLAAMFGDAVSAVGVPGFTATETAVLQPFLRNALIQVRATPVQPTTALGRARMLDGIGKAMKSLGMFAEARPVLEEALALRRSHLPDTHPDVVQSELDLGRLEAEGGDILAGIERFRLVLALQRKVGADPAAILTTRFFEGIALCSIGFPEAEEALTEVVRGREKLFGRAHRDTLLAKLGLMAWFLERQNPAAVTKLFAEIKADVAALPDERVRAILGSILDTQAKVALGNVMKKLGPAAVRGTITGIRTDIVRLTKLIPDDHILLCIFRFELAKLVVGHY
jgi:tRNA A-37 threonylcarbamoyl transferase component Bud32